WNGTVATDLNAFVDPAAAGAGWILQEANAINDNGWIVGEAYNSSTGETHAYLLVAIPEPETCALMLAGLGVLAFAARHARKAVAQSAHEPRFR
ncbi:MAG: PEP-CTERM sorting domain-containing protein, partial [Burkholderiales bacterium]|nr:PEP-CTERM sorting domain-containing protein [Burkholderiales bacterium]